MEKRINIKHYIFSLVIISILLIPIINSGAFRINHCYVGLINDILDETIIANNSLSEWQAESREATRGLQHRNECNDLCGGCGPNRENGYSSSYANGCRSWEGWSYTNYGSLDIPFWINMNSMNTIQNTDHRNLLISDIRYQASIWNMAKIHDGNTNIINLYEVGINETTKPADIDGRPVIEIVRVERNDGIVGFFSQTESQIQINYSSLGNGSRPGRNIDTPMHEIGHLLGLGDLEWDMENGIHHALMAYNRGTTESTLIDAITYHDIQGIACTNNVHTDHTFYRCFFHDGLYKSVCFYCDTIYSSKSSTVPQMIDANICEHEYEHMVSLGNKCWLKCINCYKVIEHHHSYNYSYSSEGVDYGHLAYCECGAYIQTHHTFEDHYCVYCNQYVSTHDFHSPYIWNNLRTHYATCGCGFLTLQGHVVSLNDMNVKIDDRTSNATCLLCGGEAEMGFIVYGSLPPGSRTITKNGSYIFPNGVIALSNKDMARYLD